jgi:hypothetical protein
MNQLDIFGQETEPEPDIPDYQPPVTATPLRLFEPQMEGQLALGDSDES